LLGDAIYIKEHRRFLLPVAGIFAKKNIDYYFKTMNDTESLLSHQKTFERFEFVNESPALGILLIVILSFATVFGTCGNVLILVSVCKIIKMKSLEKIFIGNLAISDMYVTLLADPMNIVSKYTA
jgi:hypothetical protein